MQRLCRRLVAARVSSGVPAAHTLTIMANLKESLQAILPADILELWPGSWKHVLDL
jgi:hypothetical protein